LTDNPTIPASAFSDVTVDEQARRVSLAIRAARDPSITNPRTWFRWALTNATDRDFRDYVPEALRLLSEPKQLYCARCHSVTTREVSPAGRFGFCDSCAEFREPRRDASGWTTYPAPAMPLRPLADGDDTEPVTREVFETSAEDALSPEQRMEWDAYRERGRHYIRDLEARIAADVAREAAERERVAAEKADRDRRSAAGIEVLRRLQADPETKDLVLAELRGGSSPTFGRLTNEVLAEGAA